MGNNMTLYNAVIYITYWNLGAVHPGFYSCQTKCALLFEAFNKNCTKWNSSCVNIYCILHSSTIENKAYSAGMF